MIKISKAHRMNKKQFNANLRRWNSSDLIYIENNVSIFLNKMEEWIKQEQQKNGQVSKYKSLYIPIGEYTKITTSASYCLSINDENWSENEFKKVVEILKKEVNRDLVFAFLIDEKRMIFCFSKFHTNDLNEIYIDRELDNFDQEFIKKINKEINK